MKLRQVGRLGFALFTAALMIASTRATTITLSTVPGAQYGPLGEIVNGVPAEPDWEAIWLDELINGVAGETWDKTYVGISPDKNAKKVFTLYDGTFNGTSVTSTDFIDKYDLPDEDDQVADDFLVKNITGTYFLLGKYDNGNGGILVWYIDEGNVDVDVALPPVALGHGLSHWAAFEAPKVPDGGTTLALLGVGLMGLVTFGRKVKNR